ncbi:acyl-CoA thioesterase [Candidatus Entotheonella palauensis]|uniref:Thioesterase n=1 Tax=Candidatus Entotheonella gemina TaxID=1429439 RepID=W4M5W0_9BACT|nr:acyl-CoA thioesterase [Candidatus Entotheonella palauensis]ETX05568.1 MAG: hypothetical protein ETSY2_22225 [Candidatus Entotheonella gemina]
MQTEFDIVVTASDLDELGHVNNARYLNFLEAGRMDWYAKIGLIASIEAAQHTSGFDTVVVNINIDFSRECLLGEHLKVETSPERLGRKSLALRQVINKPSGDLAAEAVVTSVVMDLQTRTAVVLPDSLAAFFDGNLPDAGG